MIFKMDVMRAGCELYITWDNIKIKQLYDIIRNAKYHERYLLSSLKDFNRYGYVFINSEKLNAVISPKLRANVDVINQVMYIMNFPMVINSRIEFVPRRLNP